MHFFAPANLMRLLENTYGKKTSPDVIATAMTVGKSIGKVAVRKISFRCHLTLRAFSCKQTNLFQMLAGNCYGFVGNRMYGLYIAESDFLLEEGAYPEEVTSLFSSV